MQVTELSQHVDTVPGYRSSRPAVRARSLPRVTAFEKLKTRTEKLRIEDGVRELPALMSASRRTQVSALKLC